jgi:hypothetical protein
METVDISHENRDFPSRQFHRIGADWSDARRRRFRRQGRRQLLLPEKILSGRKEVVSYDQTDHHNGCGCSIGRLYDRRRFPRRG